jgi:hypothetical protein
VALLEERLQLADGTRVVGPAARSRSGCEYSRKRNGRE